jgi:hypothetical protein
MIFLIEQGSASIDSQDATADSGPGNRLAIAARPDPLQDTATTQTDTQPAPQLGQNQRRLQLNATSGALAQE